MGANGEIFLNHFGCDISPLMIEMEQDRPVADLAASYSQIGEALSQFTILSAILHALIEAVDGHNVGFPAGSIMPIPCGLGWRDPIHQRAK